jgi:hypothetical protein
MFGDEHENDDVSSSLVDLIISLLDPSGQQRLKICEEFTEHNGILKKESLENLIVYKNSVTIDDRNQLSEWKKQGNSMFDVPAPSYSSDEDEEEEDK